MNSIQPLYPISSQSLHNVRLCSTSVLIRILSFLSFTPASKVGSCWSLGDENPWIETLANNTLISFRVGGNSSSWVSQSRIPVLLGGASRSSQWIHAPMDGSWHQSNFSLKLLGAASIVWFLWVKNEYKCVCSMFFYFTKSLTWHSF